MKNWIKKSPAFLLAGLMSPTMSLAEPIPLDWQDESAWRYSASTTVFLPFSTEGTSTVAGASVDLDLDFEDAFELLEFAASGRIEAWRNDFGLIFEVNHVDLGLDLAFTLPPTTPGMANVDVQQSWAGLLLAKRVAYNTYGPQNRQFSFDIQGGVRYNRLKQEIAVVTPVVAPVLGGSETWWEPVIGGRASWVLNDRWRAAIAADFSGFGAGGNDLQIGATAGASYRIGKNKSLRFGYRYFSMDYSTTRADGTFAYDAVQHGPYFAFTWHFQ